MFRSKATDTRTGFDRERNFSSDVIVANRRHQAANMGTGDFGTSPIFAQLSDKRCLSVILAGASERKAQWRNGKEPDLGEDDFEAPADEGARMTREKAVDLVMNAQQGVCRRAGCCGARGTRCWNSGAKTARIIGFNRRKMEDQRRTAAEKEVVTRRREFLWSLASF